jgi:hypothetical protein
MILRALVRLIGEVAIWTAIVALVAGGVTLGTRWVLQRDDRPSPLMLAGMTLGGALLFAGLSDRLDLPQPLGFDIGRRPVPFLWVLAGALAGAVVYWISQRKVRA